jgi:hypothetical protein
MELEQGLQREEPIYWCKYGAEIEGEPKYDVMVGRLKGSLRDREKTLVGVPYIQKVVPLSEKIPGSQTLFEHRDDGTKTVLVPLKLSDGGVPKLRKIKVGRGSFLNRLETKRVADLKEADFCFMRERELYVDTFGKVLLKAEKEAAKTKKKK